ncbi:MAG: glycoside hydrolase family 127 protein [Tannerella sp.]|nr:glycoside hydrolase family 127 protein [Tannerella sp.]
MTSAQSQVPAPVDAQKQADKSGYPITPVPFTSVKITDVFWGQRLKASREVTVPLAFSKCEETGRYENFVKASHPSIDYVVTGYSFDDTDVYKTIEGASYSMQTYPDKKLDKYIDSVLKIVAAAQEPDGYLYTARTMNPQKPHGWAGNSRWEKVEDLSHEFYNLGHLLEGAIAHYQATGKRNFLDIAIKYADCVEREIGDAPDKLVRVPGHQIAEMGLAKLYIVTGEKKYLDLAKFFLDKRGTTERRDEYSQAHKPVIEQDEAVGHAVRAAYMYSGIADVAALTGDTAYINAIDRIWDNVAAKKLYITGGIGSTSSGEAFGHNYELPNMSAYCETCAAIGNVYWNYRLFLLHGESKYYDVLERTLYNGLISGISLDGGSFFYPNPLESMGQHQRQPWFGCACCPSNVCRFIPSVPGYVYAVHEHDLYVNLFMSNTSEIILNGKKIKLTQTTEYPWNGDIRIDIAPSGQQTFALKIRIPGWLRNEVTPSNLYRYSDEKTLKYNVKVNGQAIESDLDKGYFVVNRTWKKGDNVEVHFDMEPRTVKANYKVEADRGRVSVERGPVVYCAEWPDNDFSVLSVLLNRKPEFTITAKPDFLNGINEITTGAQTLKYDDKGRLQTKDVTLALIPYYAWAHRGSGEMSVWLPQDLSATRPVIQPTATSGAKITASHEAKAILSINDGLLPSDDINDRTAPYYHWWPKEGTTEWIAYELTAPHTISSSSIYWFDDSPWGGCRVPKSWKLYYQNASGEWTPVNNTTSYPTVKDENNRVRFEPVTTKAVKIEVVLPDKNAAGLYEWSVD